MFRKITLLFFCIFYFGYFQSDAISSEPGKRVDQTPWFGSISDKIVDQYEKLYELKEDKERKISSLIEERNKKIAKINKKKSEAPNWAIIRKSKDDYNEIINELSEEYAKEISEINLKYNTKIQDQKNEIVDSMASPSTDDLKQKKEAATKCQYLSEMYETYSAIINVRDVVKSLNSELRLNLSDYKLACRTYATQLELLSMMNHVNDIFIDRLESFYRVNMKKRIENNEIAIERNSDDLKKNKNIPKDYVERQNEKLKMMNKSIKKALSSLDLIKNKQLKQRELIT